METGVRSIGKSSGASKPSAVNAMSVDVEDYFQVSAFKNQICREAWDALPCRVERNIDRILHLFSDMRISATFFVLGWMAQRYPLMVQRIANCGHEIASHGMAHERATEQTPDRFLRDVRDARRLLQDTSGQPVNGYRAPSYSIGRENLWALDCLQAVGYRYSSSIYPVRHDHYGMPEAPRFAFRFETDGLLELPVTTCRVAGLQIPCGGGGFFRLYPYALSRWAIRRVNRVDRQSAIFYFHPWEIDPEQPRVSGIRMKTRLRHYLNLSRTEIRLRGLLTDFRWDRVDRVFPIDGAGFAIVPRPSSITASSETPAAVGHRVNRP